MGYRSQVYIAVPKSDEKQLDAILGKHSLNKEFRKEEYNNSDTEYIIYSDAWLKWYNGYEDVNAVNKFIAENPIDGGVGRALFCIGEGEEIHSEIGDYYEIWNVYTTVELQ
ncbi:MAG: hypothetical protein NZ735_07180 [Candidatus Marinimicrobia bacterium]|nr:hypothetical protein [Candidatus Neomarinimicrobiota bacterium]